MQFSSRLSLLLLALHARYARGGVVGKPITGQEYWETFAKRCDMVKDVFHGPHGAPAYTEGKWQARNDERKSPTEMMPMDCKDPYGTTPCGFNRCWDSQGTSSGIAGSKRPSGYCNVFHDKCYSPRTSESFAQNLRYLAYAWRPSNDCYFSPLAVMTGTQWHHWAKNIEAAAGPTLFVGDANLAQLFMAYRSITSDAPHATYFRADTLTNTYTLMPMKPEELDVCLAKVGNPVPNTAGDSLPCPPNAKGDLHWEDNRWHQIDNLLWPKVLLEQGGMANYYKTLVLHFGTELWRMIAYSSRLPDCETANGVKDAFLPVHALNQNLPDWHHSTKCDVFSVRYPIIVQNIARFLGNLRGKEGYFNGHVIFMTTPPHVPGCAAAKAPNAEPAVTAAEPDVTKEAYYYSHARYAESIWRPAFQKWAPRLKLSILNVTHVSETRADARTPGDCGRHCFPGVPHVWAEMLLRLLEQHHFRI